MNPDTCCMTPDPHTSNIEVIETTPASLRTFSIDLHETDLVALGLLSFRHEIGAGPTFYEKLPNEIKAKVQNRAQQTSAVNRVSSTTTNTWVSR